MTNQIENRILAMPPMREDQLMLTLRHEFHSTVIREALTHLIKQEKVRRCFRDGTICIVPNYRSVDPRLVKQAERSQRNRDAKRLSKLGRAA